ncbi:hypothetical protein GCM10010954_11340 [Halobacillus andaensis]|uniref:Uncharacterized protein n=1 Tax=Halobacillus andaensis TaxID=1176239 RepID=A0A917B073_HALAA|nr:hypothetical protein [Halobacillus andaensis]MBP2003930.1 hypothetical protein [Halobacillus andaensis]GGF14455.1 hypothetical protein GCM10010954_11340 [Halobacillus andaensis]
MFITNVKNLQFYSQLSLKQVEDRVLITADFPKDLRMEHDLDEPFLYVTLYVRGGERIKLIDEGTVRVYSLTKKDFDLKTYNEIVQFAKEHALQFKHK